MDKKTEALKLALESLKELVADPETDFGPTYAGAEQRQKKAITAIREALAEQSAQQRPQNCGTGYCSCIECFFEQPAQQQEPVAWQWLGTAHFRKKIPADATPSHWRPLYTSQQPSTQWVGLTDEQIVQLSLEWPAETNDWASHIDFARAIEAELKEKNK